jgi:L-iditol 2-dehydrogenase
MQAAVLKATKRVAQLDVPAPAVAAGETLVQVSHSGICGTDLKIYQGGIPVEYPRIMGHESVGVVVQSDGFASGVPVIVDPAYFCGVCFHCQKGQTHICPNGGLIGRDVDGGFADYLVAPSRNIHPLPQGINPAAAPLLQPMTTCLHAQRLSGINPGESVIVQGLGVTGLLHIQLAKAHGAYPVIGITRSPWKRDLALQLGADFVLTPDRDTLQNVLQLTDGRGADLVIESVGSLPVLAEAIELVRIGGRILLFGIYTVTEGVLPFYDLYYKEIQIINSRVAKPEDFPACIDFVARGVVNLDLLISHTLPLAEIDQALDMLASGTGNSKRLKIILQNEVN